jgi:nicotinate-nucleotide--dimethylbenzimidazole phosphoribosyltransferase
VATASVLARQVGATLEVVDVGVGDPTGDLTRDPALDPTRFRACVQAGRDAVAALDADLLVVGEMGIGNTTPAAALTALLADRPAAVVTGRGTGIDDETLSRKTEVVASAVDRARTAGHVGGVDALAEVGGLEHAAIAGFILGGAALRVPVLVDGVIAQSALLAACSIAPEAQGYVVAGHRSSEPGSSVALDHLGLDPVLDLGLRLGEGTGALLALPMVQAAARLLGEMATFDQAGVSEA